MIHCDAGAVQADSKETLTKTPSRKFKQAQRGQCERYQRYFSQNRNFWSPESQTSLRNSFVYMFLNLFLNLFFQSFQNQLLWPFGTLANAERKAKGGQTAWKAPIKSWIFSSIKRTLDIAYDSTGLGTCMALSARGTGKSSEGWKFLQFSFHSFLPQLLRGASLNLFAKTSLAKFAPQLLWSSQLVFWDGMVGSICSHVSFLAQKYLWSLRKRQMRLVAEWALSPEQTMPNKPRSSRPLSIASATRWLDRKSTNHRLFIYDFRSDQLWSIITYRWSKPWESWETPWRI